MDTPTFSIIIPVYNVAPYLRECLDSVLAQTVSEWEAICVDDGSSDGSSAILDEYADKDGRFKVVHKVNEGVSIARNTALDLATGEYVGFIDGDDAIADQWLEAAESMFRQYDATMVRFRFTSWRGGKRTRLHDYSVAERIVRDSEDDVRKWGWKTYTYGGWSWLQFVKRDLIGSLRYPEHMRNREDNIFCTRLAMRQRIIVQSEYPGYYYRGRPDCSSTRNHDYHDCYRYLSECEGLWRDLKEYFLAIRWQKEAAECLSFSLRSEFFYWLDDLKGFKSQEESAMMLQVLRRLVFSDAFAISTVSEIACRFTLWVSVKLGTLSPFRSYFAIRKTYRRVRYGKQDS